VKQPLSQRILAGPTHPVCLLATAALLLNDHLWKASYHNTLTGKISDVCWLIVASVVLAALLHRCRIGAKTSQRLAVALVAGFFIALQTLPVLGDTLVGWYGGRHFADLTDLLALPALLLVPLCWRGQAKPSGLLLGLSLIACAASMPPTDSLDARFPCDSAQSWDPNVPLYLQFTAWGDASIPTRTPAFQQGIRIYTADGKEVEVFIAQNGPGSVAVCADGGLAPATEYFWTAGPFDSESLNMATMSNFGLSGTWSFTTDDTSDNNAITSWSACSGVNPNVYELLECADDPDTGSDTGSDPDTGGTAP